MDDLAGTKAAWKTAYDKIKIYNTKYTAYKNKIDGGSGGWADYKVKGEPEVKRLA